MKLRLRFTWPVAGGCRPRGWWSRPALATGASTSRTSWTSRGGASGTGLRRSRRACVETRRSFWSAAGIRRATAAVFLRGFAAKIWMLVRGPSLAESMSQYLIDRIAAADNIEVLTHTEIVALYGSRKKQLERVRWRNNATGEQTEKPIRHVFLFIGADPATNFLEDSGVVLDTKQVLLH